MKNLPKNPKEVKISIFENTKVNRKNLRKLMVDMVKLVMCVYIHISTYLPTKRTTNSYQKR